MDNVDPAMQAPSTREQMASRKVQTLIAVLRITLVLTGLAIALLFLGTQLAPGESLQIAWLSVTVCGFAVAVALVFARRGALRCALVIYLLSTGLCLFAISGYVGGPTGPMSLLFVPLIIIAALVGGRGSALMSALGVALVAGAWVALQERGLFVPSELTGSVQIWVTLSAFVLCLGATAVLVASHVRFMEDVLAASQSKERVLAEALQPAAAMAQAHEDAEGRAEGVVADWQDLVRDYVAFLNRVEEGDIDSRLDIDDLSARVPNQALLALGARLNGIVDALADSARELSTEQRRNVQEAWSMFLEKAPVDRGLRAAGGKVSVTDSVWRESMIEAARNQRPVVLPKDLALPISVRGEVVGALGAHRDGGNTWSAEELALVEAVTDQLSLTLETLRLFEETRRQAQRERALGDLSMRFGRSFDVDALLQEAVVDLGRLFGLDEVAVFLEPPVAAGPFAGSEVLGTDDGISSATEDEAYG